MKIYILYEQVKIKHNTLLLIRFYQVENIKSVISFSNIANALGRLDIPLTDRKVGSYHAQDLGQNWHFFEKMEPKISLPLI